VVKKEKDDDKMGENHCLFKFLKREDKSVYMQIIGSFTTNCYSANFLKLVKRLSKEGFDKFFLDMSKTYHIDSGGIQALVDTSHFLGKGNLKIISLSEEIKMVFISTGQIHS